ncbi:esterase-like activity of phytase family protein (plasmid) [Paroceanicella profunda]|uniref:Esterase-like activity of phytase family protein n=2 Tax=Paroceanicella profunda TaxID=2579971 RepID=A0A5B8FJ55_9RHOB|nr:esterase-like activity of phytase family protein [Paroceanicella profunda]QDL94531.1 esterase-like activity of phytase family protein [Paroceanicella profunda]
MMALPAPRAGAQDATVAAPRSFNRIASFAVNDNLPAGTDPKTETSAEIIYADETGMTLVYTDSPLGVVGRIDISDPEAPKPLGVTQMNGEPTSVVVIGERAYVGVNTSPSYTEPSGKLVSMDLASGAETASCDIGGQPDSVAAARDASFIAVAVENERDEELGDGGLPQMPAGYVVVLPLIDGVVDCAAMVKADVTGLAEVAPEDPEPEFVDVNSRGEIAVTLQENNHIVVLDRTGKVLSHFSAGTVDLEGIDTQRDGALSFTDSQAGVAREPDSIQWLGDDRLVIANEGDWKGGARGWTVFSPAGEVLYENGTGFEKAIVQIGHYPEKRSNKKGVEPEAVETATFDGTPYAFIGSERGSVLGVYDMSGATPVLRQLLPSGMAPEGLVAIPSRGLLVSANESDLGAEGGARAQVMIYRLEDGPAAYPSLTSEGADELIGWGALSGLSADPDEAGRLYAVNDSFYAMQPTIFTIDATAKPARITAALPVTRGGQPAQKLDMEGIFADADGSFWIGNEGNTEKLVPHAILHVGADGAIREEIGFPAALLAGETRFGIEGITRIGDRLWLAIQRPWGDDPKGMVKLVSYDLASKDWGAVHYPLDTAGAGWIGLSEIALQGDRVLIVERDNQIGAAARVKKLYAVPVSALQPAPLGDALPVVTKTLVHDFLPDLAAPKGYVVDKIEGFTVDAAGEGFAVTDNDGVDDSSGETHFFSIGKP